MKLSYLVTCKNEDRTLQNLLERLETYAVEPYEVVILADVSDNPKTADILYHYSRELNFRVIQHPLDRNYGTHKNFGGEQCKGKWIFQIDGDECPTIDLVINVVDIIETNSAVDLIYVPRINDFIGVTPQHAKMWGWHLSPCPVYNNRPIVNWHDPQSRIYRNDPSRIKWDRRLHEKIEGHKEFASLPADYNLALYHDKTIETQLATNKRYNEWFTAEENRGHDVFTSKTSSSKP